MSVKLSAYVWDGCASSGMKTMKIAIMARLADFSNDEGVCWPSVDTIARQVGAGRSTVITAINELAKDGWLTKKERRNGQRSATNVYRLNVAKLRVAANAIYSQCSESGRPECERSEFEYPESERSENPKKIITQGPESGHDPSVSSKEDPLDIKPIGQSPAATDKPQSEKVKIDYLSALDAYHSILPEMPKVIDMTSDRQKKLRELWKQYDFNLDRWTAYLCYIAKHCRWMLENRPDTTSGKTWRKKNFDYLITTKCYLSVKEERANDLPKVEKIDIAAREDALRRLVANPGKPRNAVEEIAKVAASKASLGRMNETAARIAWRDIWAQALTQASENDLARLAS